MRTCQMQTAGADCVRLCQFYEVIGSRKPKRRATIMGSTSFYRSILRLLNLFTGALVAIALPGASWALPKRGGAICNCFCEAYVGGHTILAQNNYIAPPGQGCNALTGLVCTVEDPSTGGVNTGSTTACG